MAQQYDGSIRIDTSIDTRGIATGIQSITNTLNKLASVIGATFSTVAIINFGKSCVSTAMEIENSGIGLKSIVEGQGRSFSKANQFIQDYIADGLVPLQNAVTTYKNLASRGYSEEQIQNVMIALKNSATYGRQASLTLGYAVQSASEGLKNENSILVDNAGVTKNVSVMWKDYAKSIGVSYTELTKQQKIQAEVNGILEETQFQMGDAEKASNTFTGQISRLSVSFTNLKSAIGNAIIPILEKIIPYLDATISKLTSIFEKIANITKSLFGSDLEKNSNKTPISVSPNLDKDINNATDSTKKLTQATDDLATTTANASKEAKGALASFDELEVISLNQDDTSGNIANSDNADDITSINDNTDALSNLNSVTTDLADNTDTYTLSNSRLLNSLKKLKAQLDRLAEFSGQALIDFYEHFLKPLGKWTINEALPRFIDALANNMAKVNWQGINDALVRLWDTLEPFTETIGEGLLWFWEEVLTPLGTWTLNNAVPTFLDLLSASIELLHTVIQVFKPFGLWIWQEFLKPIAKWTGGVIISVLKGITNLLQDFTAYLRENQSTIETWIPLVTGIASAIATALAFKGIAKILPKFSKIGSAVIGLTTKIGTLATSFGSLVSSVGILDAIKITLTGLWTTFVAFMRSLSPLAKIGVTVAGIVATFTTAYSAIKKLSDGSLTLGETLKNIIPVTVAVGIALYAMLGPIGIVVTALGTIAGACAGAISATKELTQNIVSTAVFNDIGTPITEYTTNIHNLADTISNEQSKILSLGDTIENNNQAIENNLTDLGMLIGQVNATGTITEDNANKIISSFNAVADSISENLSLGTQSIIEGLGSSFTELAGTSGTMVSDMLSHLYLLQSEGDAYLATMKSDFTEATMQMLQLEKGTPEYEEASKKVEELRLQIGEYSSITNDAINSADLFKQSLSNINDETISFMDNATATQSINDMTNDYSKAMTDLEEARATALKGVENEMKALEYRQGSLTSSDIKYFDDLSNLINENYNSQESELSTTFKNITNKIENQMTTAFDSAIIDAEYPIYHSVGGFFQYMSEAIKNLGSSTTAEESLRNNLYETIAGSTNDAIDNAKTTIKSKSLAFGENIDDGIIEGINNHQNDVAESMIQVGEYAHQEFQKVNEIHSPSKLYQKDGEYIVEGLVLGVDNNKQSVLTSIQNISNDMRNKLQDELYSIPDIFNNVFNSILSSMNDFNYNLSNSIKYSLNGIINNLNQLFSGINQVNFELPMGYGHFGVTIPQIPHLATGDLIPPRNEFMAILGDNTTEHEIVSPVSTMVDAMKKAIIESGLGNNQSISVNIDGKELFTIMVDKNRQYMKQTGKSAF